MKQLKKGMLLLLGCLLATNLLFVAACTHKKPNKNPIETSSSSSYESDESSEEPFIPGEKPGESQGSASSESEIHTCEWSVKNVITEKDCTTDGVIDYVCKVNVFHLLLV